MRSRTPRGAVTISVRMARRTNRRHETICYAPIDIFLNRQGSRLADHRREGGVQGPWADVGPRRLMKVSRATSCAAHQHPALKIMPRSRKFSRCCARSGSPGALQKGWIIHDRFLLNWDESDWCLRASKAGYSLLMVRDAVIHHVGSASMGGARSPVQAYFMARNLLLFGKKHFSIAQRVRQLRLLAWQARELSRPTSDRLWLADILVADSGSCAAFRRGVIDYFLGR